MNYILKNLTLDTFIDKLQLYFDNLLDDEDDVY